MESMLFASVIESIFRQKSYIIFSIDKENRFQHKIVFKDLGLPPKGSPEGKIVIFHEVYHINKISFKNHKCFYKI